MLPVSEVLVREVKVVTNGFAPEFGQTTGMVYNAITPSGTNDLHGSASFRFKRNPMSRPAVLPLADSAQARHRGQRLHRGARRTDRQRTRSHFFGAYEYVDRSLSPAVRSSRSTPPTAPTLGITLPSSGVIPAHQKVNFVFGKTDYQINPANQLSVRYFLFKNFSASNIGGGLTTTDRATDFTDRMDSASAQLVSTHRLERC